MQLIILPIAFLICWIFIETNRAAEDSDWRLSFLLAFVFTNAYLIVLTEVLNLFHGITVWGVFGGWVFFSLVLCAILFIKRKTRPVKFPHFRLENIGLWDGLLIGLIVLIFLTIAVVALLSRPYVSDVLHYHLPRVAHWIQNRSVNHFASGIEIQNRYPPAAEYQVLHVFILAGSDLFVKFPAWAVLVVGAVSGSLFASKLGITRTGSTLTALFIATLPVALMQATSVKNDIHVATFTLLLVTLMLSFLKGRPTWTTMAAIGLTFAMGYLTKSTTVLFMAPLIVWFGIRCLKQFKFSKVALWVLLVVLLFLMLSGGFFVRNMTTFGSLQDVGASSRLLNDEFTVKGTFSNLLRNTVFHLQYPWEGLRDWFEITLIKVHVKLGMDINDPRYTSEGTFAIKPPGTSSTLSGNTFHAHLLLVSMLVSIYFLIKKIMDSAIWLPIVLGGAGYLIFSVVIKWQVFGARYSLAVFFLMAPIFGAVISKISLKWVRAACGLVLIVLSLPWLVSIHDRALVPLRRFTSSQSLFVSNRFDFEPQYPVLAALPEWLERYDCDQIGIYGTGALTEYNVWSALDAPRDDIRIEWLVAGTPSAKYVDDGFSPCLIVCAQCSPELEEIRGLVPLLDDFYFTLYGPE